MPSAVIKEIRGRKFSFAKLPATKGIRLQMLVARLAGATPTEWLAKADPDDLLATMDLVFTKGICDGRPIGDIDSTFGDDTQALVEAFEFAVEVNLKDFLAESRSTGSPPETQTPSP